MFIKTYEFAAGEAGLIEMVKYNPRVNERSEFLWEKKWKLATS